MDIDSSHDESDTDPVQNGHIEDSDLDLLGLGLPDEELKKAQRAEQRVKKAERMMSDLKATARPAVPALGEMIERVLTKFGGPDAFAAAFYDVYTSAPVGSPTKARLIEKFMDVIKSYNQLNPSNEGADLSHLSDGELEQLIQSLVK